MPKVSTPAYGTVDTYKVTISGTTPAVPPYEVKIVRTALPDISEVKTSGGKAGYDSKSRSYVDARVGNTITAKAQQWNGSKLENYPSNIKVTYKWYRDGKPITGATGPTRKLTSWDAGHKITVKATASAPTYPDVTYTSYPIQVAKTTK